MTTPTDPPPDQYEIRARVLRILAARARARAAELEMAATAVLATRSLKRFAEVMTESEAREIAEHPDLAELNAQMKGFYEPESP
ncbi:hypothetical protein ABZX65_26525 [Streptomyces sp. NPDC003300]|uniref:hypothetical protein n=1 Tax=unclassified Streptomyces TaxID=2593676 RepID=UPI00339F8CC4